MENPFSNSEMRVFMQTRLNSLETSYISKQYKLNNLKLNLENGFLYNLCKKLRLLSLFQDLKIFPNIESDLEVLRLSFEPEIRKTISIKNKIDQHYEEGIEFMPEKDLLERWIRRYGNKDF